MAIFFLLLLMFLYAGAFGMGLMLFTAGIRDDFPPSIFIGGVMVIVVFFSAMESFGLM